MEKFSTLIKKLAEEMDHSQLSKTIFCIIAILIGIIWLKTLWPVNIDEIARNHTYKNEDGEIKYTLSNKPLLRSQLRRKFIKGTITPAENYILKNSDLYERYEKYLSNLKR